jgi:hypothetical protein
MCEDFPMSRYRATLSRVLLVLGLVVAGQAWAHHSIAAYDRDHPETVAGTVRQFKFTNPHTWIYLMVSDPDGVEHQWDLVGSPGAVLVRQGWNAATLRPGMKITLLIAPRRDGVDHGEWEQLLTIDGRPFVPPRR